MLFKSSSVSSILKGTVLARRLLRIVPTPVKARTLLQISFFTFGTKGGWSEATCNSSLHGSRTEQVRITVFECSCSEHAKGERIVAFSPFCKVISWLMNQKPMWIKISGFDAFRTFSQEKGREYSWVKFFSWLFFQPPSLDNYPSTLHA